MPRRREFLATTGGIGVALLSGCLGFVTGQNALEREAKPTRITTEALTETGYNRKEIRTIKETETVEIAGETRTVIVKNSLSVYDRSSTDETNDSDGDSPSLQPESFLLLSTPDINEFGQSLNPYADIEGDDIINIFDSENRIRYINELDQYAVLTLGESVTVTRYEVREERDGAVEEFIAHTTSVAEDGDVIHVYGRVPKAAGSPSEDDVETLIEGIER